MIFHKIIIISIYCILCTLNCVLIMPADSRKNIDIPLKSDLSSLIPVEINSTIYGIDTSDYSVKAIISFKTGITMGGVWKQE